MSSKVIRKGGATQRQPYITRRHAGASRWVLRLEGDHDVSTSANLRKELDGVLEPGARVVVDLTDAQLIDSSILGELVNAHERAQSSSADEALAVVAPPGTAAAKLFDLVGAREFIPTFDSCADAFDR
jgi:anti-anti-sigma factor